MNNHIEKKTTISVILWAWLITLLCLAFNIGSVRAAADDISRLYNFTPGSVLSSSAFNQEFNQIITTLNGKFGRAIDNTISGNNIFSGDNTFSGANSFSDTVIFSHSTTPLQTDKVLERTTGAGVTVDGVVIRDTTIQIPVSSDPGTLAEGQVWYNTTSDQLKYYDGATTRVLAITAPTVVYPEGFIAGPPPEWVDATAIRIPAGARFASKTYDFDLKFTSNKDCDFDNSNGAGGLDIGGKSNNTWYYVYGIGDSTAVNATSCMFSATNESVSGSITMPSGYDKKRQLPYVVRVNSSGNIISQKVAGGWPFNPLILYQVDFDTVAGTTPTEVLSGGAATTATAVGLSSYVPPVSTIAYLKWMINANGTPSIYLRATGATDFDRLRATSFTGGNTYIGTNSSQSIDYKLDTASYPIDLAVYGYVINGFI